MALVASALGFDGKSYSGEDFRQMIEGLAGVNGITTTPGVTLGFKATAQASPNATVSVALGWAIVTATAAGTGGMYHVANGAALASPSFTATSGNGRKDRLILRITSGVPALEIVQGTASGSPVEPAITGDNYLELALVTLPASTTNIAANMITDRRVFTGKWASPWGSVATPVSWTSDTSTTTTVTSVTGATITWTAVTGRMYRIRFSLHNYSTVANDTTRYYITDVSNSIKGIPGTFDVGAMAVGTTATYFEVVGYETGITNGNVTRRLMFNRAAGTGTVHAFADATRPGSVLVEDIGPASAPD